MPPARRLPHVLVVPLLVLAAGLAGAPAAHADNLSVDIARPTSGQVSGLVYVKTTAVAPTGDADHVDLLVDGELLTSSACVTTGSEPGNACADDVPWDASQVRGDHTLQEVLTTRSGATATSPTYTVTVVPPPPTASFTSPSRGATATGVVHLAATATAPADSTDPAASVSIDNGGVPLATMSCPAPQGGQDPVTCDVAYDWNTAALQGDQFLGLVVTTASGKQFPQIGLDVRLDNPAPTVTLTPADGATVHGVVPVRVQVQVDPREQDSPATVALSVDGVQTSTATCPASDDPRSCTVDLTWDASRLTAGHVLTALATTRQGAQAATQEFVAVSTALHFTLGALPTAVPATAEPVNGTVTLVNSGQPYTGALDITVTPAVGAARVYHVTTDEAGRFAQRATVNVNSTVVIAAPASPQLLARTATEKALVRPNFICSVTTTRVKHGTRGSGACQVPYLPAGTAAAVQADNGHGWRTLGTVKTTTGRWTWPFTLAKGAWQLRISLPTNPSLVAGTSPTMKATVT